MSGIWLDVVVVAQILVAIAIIGLVLLQHGKGADMGSGFGGGASGSLFGASGSANFLSRTTAVLAAVFFGLSLTLAYFYGAKPPEARSVVESPVPAPTPNLNRGGPQAPNSKSPPQGASGAPQPAPVPEKSVPQ